jgi:hypothetical protein
VFPVGWLMQKSLAKGTTSGAGCGVPLPSRIQQTRLALFALRIERAGSVPARIRAGFRDHQHARHALVTNLMTSRLSGDGESAFP